MRHRADQHVSCLACGVVFKPDLTRVRGDLYCGQRCPDRVWRGCVTCGKPFRAYPYLPVPQLDCSARCRERAKKYRHALLSTTPGYIVGVFPKHAARAA